MGFKELNDKVRDSDSFDFWDVIEDLSQNEHEELILEIKSWGDDKLLIGHDILSQYASIKISNNDMKEILVKNLDSAYEIFNESIVDTCVRDVFINQVLIYFGLNSWPTYGSSKEYKQEWEENFKKAAADKKFEIID